MDAAFKDLHATTRTMLRDHIGCVVGAWKNHFLSPSALCAEMEVVVQAISKAEELNLDRVIFESDSLGVVFALQGVNDYEVWQFRSSLLQGKCILTIHPLWSCKHISRRSNRSAHNLAHWARLSNYSGEVNINSLHPSIFCNDGGSFVNPHFDINADD